MAHTSTFYAYIYKKIWPMFKCFKIYYSKKCILKGINGNVSSVVTVNYTSQDMYLVKCKHHVSRFKIRMLR